MFNVTLESHLKVKNKINKASKLQVFILSLTLCHILRSFWICLCNVGWCSLAMYKYYCITLTTCKISSPLLTTCKIGCSGLVLCTLGSVPISMATICKENTFCQTTLFYWTWHSKPDIPVSHTHGLLGHKIWLLKECSFLFSFNKMRGCKF